jgi:hypothetical protein
MLIKGGSSFNALVRAMKQDLVDGSKGASARADPNLLYEIDKVRGAAAGSPGSVARSARVRRAGGVSRAAAGHHGFLVESRVVIVCRGTCKGAAGNGRDLAHCDDPQGRSTPATVVRGVLQLRYSLGPWLVRHDDYWGSFALGRQ